MTYSNILEIHFDHDQRRTAPEEPYVSGGSDHLPRIKLTSRDYAKLDFNFMHNSAQLAQFTPEQREAWIVERTRKYEAEAV